MIIAATLKFYLALLIIAGVDHCLVA